MPKYRFDLQDNGHPSGLDERVVLPGLGAALQEAIEAIVDVAKDEIPADGMSRDLALTVRDDQGELQYRVKLVFEVERMQADAPSKG